MWLDVEGRDSKGKRKKAKGKSEEAGNFRFLLLLPF
jgi:hypothetical protein